jgi:lipopolysaccharide export system permease protein
MRTLDRYVLKNFVTPFLYCFLGFVAVWLVIDLSDNGSDFIKGDISLSGVAAFYFKQLPDITVICLPVGLLLALLYSLSRMSRSNELISMLTAGVSLPRILLPLFFAGLVGTAISLALNIHLAPKAQADKERRLKELTGSRQDTEFVAHLFRNRKANRTWYIEKVQLEKNLMRGAQIIQQDEAGNTQFQYYVRNAEFQPQTKTWYFDKGVIIKYDPEGNMTSKEILRGQTIISGWDENPRRIASANLKPEFLTVAELQDYLEYNSDFPDANLAPFRTHLQHRWALPWTCFVVVLFAAPLGIIYSRRGVLAGVASSIFIFAAFMFLTQLFLALGSGHRIPAAAAAWTPNILFLLTGLVLLWVRSSNRDFSSLNPATLFRHKGHPRPARTSMAS